MEVGEPPTSGPPEPADTDSPEPIVHRPNAEPVITAHDRDVKAYDTSVHLRREILILDAPDVAFGLTKKPGTFRHRLLKFLYSDWFELFSSLIILANALLLMLFQPMEPPDSPTNAFVGSAQLPFTILFTIEIIIKFLALGFWLFFVLDWFNILDFVVVILGYIALLPSVANLNAIRMLRLLKMMTLFGPTRVVLVAVGNSLSGLTNLACLAVLFLLTFSLLGVQLWAGVMSGRCGYVDPGTNKTLFAPYTIYCGLPCSEFEGTTCTPTYGNSCPAATVPVTRYSPNGAPFLAPAVLPLTCMRDAPPDFGQRSFDNVLYAMLVSFVSWTTESWTSTMVVLWGTWGLDWLVAILFVCFTFLGSLFVLELALAVIWDKFGDARDIEKERRAALMALLQQLRGNESLTAALGSNASSSTTATLSSRRTQSTNADGFADPDGAATVKTLRLINLTSGGFQHVGSGSSAPAPQEPKMPSKRAPPPIFLAAESRRFGPRTPSSSSSSSSSAAAPSSSPADGEEGGEETAKDAAKEAVSNFAGNLLAVHRAVRTLEPGQRPPPRNAKPFRLRPAALTAQAAVRALKNVRKPGEEDGATAASSVAGSPSGSAADGGNEEAAPSEAKETATPSGHPTPTSGAEEKKADDSGASGGFKIAVAVVKDEESGETAVEVKPVSPPPPAPVLSPGATKTVMSALAGGRARPPIRLSVGPSNLSASSPSSELVPSFTSYPAGVSSPSSSRAADGAWKMPTLAAMPPSDVSSSASSVSSSPSIKDLTATPSAGTSTPRPSVGGGFFAGFKRVLSISALSKKSPTAQSPAGALTDNAVAAAAVSAFQKQKKAKRRSNSFHNFLRRTNNSFLKKARSEKCSQMCGRHCLHHNYSECSTRAREAKTTDKLNAFWQRVVPDPPAALRSRALAAVNSFYYNATLICIVMANAIVLGCESADMSDATTEALAIVNAVIVACFIIELFVKILAYGVPRAIFRSFLSFFDFVVIIMSLADVILDFEGMRTGPARFLRISRVMRVLRLGELWPSLRALVIDLLAAIPDAFSAVIILAIFMLAMAVLGMHIFGGGGFKEALANGTITEIPRYNFNSLGNALVTTFILIDNENWNDVLFSHMAVFGPASALYFVFVLLFGNMALLNVVTAVILQSMEARSSPSVVVEGVIASAAKTVWLTLKAGWTSCCGPQGRLGCCCRGRASRVAAAEALPSPAVSPSPPAPPLHNALRAFSSAAGESTSSGSREDLPAPVVVTSRSVSDGSASSPHRPPPLSRQQSGGGADPNAPPLAADINCTGIGLLLRRNGLLKHVTAVIPALYRIDEDVEASSNSSASNLAPSASASSAASGKSSQTTSQPMPMLIEVDAFLEVRAQPLTEANRNRIVNAFLPASLLSTGSSGDVFSMMSPGTPGGSARPSLAARLSMMSTRGATNKRLSRASSFVPQANAAPAPAPAPAPTLLIKRVHDASAGGPIEGTLTSGIGNSSSASPGARPPVSLQIAIQRNTSDGSMLLAGPDSAGGPSTGDVGSGFLSPPAGHAIATPKVPAGPTDPLASNALAAAPLRRAGGADVARAPGKSAPPALDRGESYENFRSVRGNAKSRLSFAPLAGGMSATGAGGGGLSGALRTLSSSLGASARKPAPAAQRPSVATASIGVGALGSAGSMGNMTPFRRSDTFYSLGNTFGGANNGNSSSSSSGGGLGDVLVEAEARAAARLLLQAMEMRGSLMALKPMSDGMRAAAIIAAADPNANILERQAQVRGRMLKGGGFAPTTAAATAKPPSRSESPAASRSQSPALEAVVVVSPESAPRPDGSPGNNDAIPKFPDEGEGAKNISVLRLAAVSVRRGSGFGGTASSAGNSRRGSRLSGSGPSLNLPSLGLETTLKRPSQVGSPSGAGAPNIQGMELTPELSFALGLTENRRPSPSHQSAVSSRRASASRATLRRASLATPGDTAAASAPPLTADAAAAASAVSEEDAVANNEVEDEAGPPSFSTFADPEVIDKRQHAVKRDSALAFAKALAFSSAVAAAAAADAELDPNSAGSAPSESSAASGAAIDETPKRKPPPPPKRVSATAMPAADENEDGSGAVSSPKASFAPVHVDASPVPHLSAPPTLTRSSKPPLDAAVGLESDNDDSSSEGDAASRRNSGLSSTGGAPSEGMKSPLKAPPKPPPRPSVAPVERPPGIIAPPPRKATLASSSPEPLSKRARDSLALPDAAANGAADRALKSALAVRARDSMALSRHHKALSPIQSAKSLNPMGLDGDDDDDDDEFAQPAEDIELPPQPWIVKAWNVMRDACRNIDNFKYFSTFVNVIILISCVNLALDAPNVQTCYTPVCNALKGYLAVADVIITVVFTVEFCVQIMARGVIRGPEAYFRSGWRWVDALTTAASIASLCVASDSVRSLRGLRAARALRPLRLIARVPRLRLVVDALLVSFPRARNVLFLIFIVVYLFALIGLVLFSGNMSSCNDPMVPNAAQCVGMFRTTGDLCDMQPTNQLILQCLGTPGGLPFPRVWAPQRFNFDNIGHALLTVFDLFSGEAWPVIQLVGLDSTAPGMAPALNAAPGAAAFYCLATLVLNITLLELVSSVVVDTYQRLKNERNGCATLTKEQSIWVSNVRTIFEARLPAVVRPPESRFGWLRSLRKATFNLVGQGWFELVVVCFILLNALACAMHFYGEQDAVVSAQEGLNYLVTAAFVLECSLKVIGLGWRQYFQSSWNVFDFVLVIGSILSAILQSGLIGSALRVFRVARLFRVVRISSGLRRLLRTFLVSIPTFTNILAILALLVFMFAVVGMNIFSGVKLSSSSVIDVDTNFDTFGNSIIALLRFSTGEDFTIAMLDLALQPPYCIPSGPGDNCGVALVTSSVFFVSFFVSSVMIMAMLTAVILEAFDESRDEADKEIYGIYRLTPAMASLYSFLWLKEDPEAKMVLPMEKIRRVIASLPVPLGTGPPDALYKLQHVISAYGAASGEEEDQQAKVRPGYGHNHNKSKGKSRQGRNSGSQAPDASRKNRSSTRQSMKDGPRTRSFLRLESFDYTQDETTKRALTAAARLMSRLPLVPSASGQYSFYSLFLALCDRAGREPALGSPVDVLINVSMSANPAQKQHLCSEIESATVQESAAAALVQRRWKERKRLQEAALQAERDRMRAEAVLKSLNAASASATAPEPSSSSSSSSS